MGDLVSRIGVEEEFHLVDLQTRAAEPAIDAMLAQLDGDSFARELQRSLVEANTLPCESLDELRAELCRLRRRLNQVADPLGLGVVAAGTVPLVDLLGSEISAGARYERMQHEYQLLVREQHICGAQVHVDVPDRDVAVAVVQHVALHLPTFLALSASSPYWRGVDSGYASYRCMRRLSGGGRRRAHRRSVPGTGATGPQVGRGGQTVSPDPPRAAPGSHLAGGPVRAGG